MSLRPFAFFLFAGALSAHAAHYDVLDRGGRVLDGSGTPWFYADVALHGDRMAAFGKLTDATATLVVDARGFYAAPGFIDGHSHAGLALARNGALAASAPMLTQGITTVFVNHDGGGPISPRNAGRSRRICSASLSRSSSATTPSAPRCSISRTVRPRRRVVRRIRHQPCAR